MSCLVGGLVEITAPAQFAVGHALVVVRGFLPTSNAFIR